MINKGRRLLRLVVPAVALIIAGCSAPTDGPAAAPTPPSGSGSASAHATDWLTRCREQVSYWTTTVLAEPDHSYDYQEMGLSAETYDALRAVLAAAGDRPRDQPWVEEHSRTACAAVAATASPGAPGDPGWP